MSVGRLTGNTSELGVGSVSLGIHYRSGKVRAEALVRIDW
jgi:hypothetical protein